MATSADWNMWLGQGQNRQVDPLAPLNQQFGGSLTGAPAQGYGQTSINTPGQLGDPGSAGMWNGAYTQGDRDNRVLTDDWNKWRTEPTTPTIPQQAAPLERWQQGAGQGQSMSGEGLMSNLQAPKTPEPQLVNPKTGGAGGTPTATGWTDTSVPDLTLQSDNAANKPKGPGATGVFANDQWVNEAGNRFDYGDATQAPGRARAGTALAKGAVKTWVNYDGSRDTQLHDYNGIDQETSWRRVNRWTQEGVAEHGLTPQEAHNAALARLKRDFELTNLDWRNSGFDLSNVQSAAPGQDWAKANAVGAAPGTAPGAVPGVAPGTTPGVAPGATPTTPTVPQTGGGTTTPGAPGLFTDEGSVSAAAQSPAAALLAFQKAAGGVNKSGPLGKYRENLMSQALQAYLGAYGIGGNVGNGGALGNANQGIEEMMSRLASGQGVGDWLRGATQKAMDGVDFSGMDGEQIKNILSLVGGAGTFGMGPMGQYAMNNALDDLEYQVGQQGLFDPLVNPDGSKPTSVLANPNNRRTFEELMRKYQAML